ncbi:hypothetical protein HHTV1_45 [Haloarcula hispanica tailed virus 1]|uniref:Uncharacterized protein n=1 Tax=Haloarcula hispanica tailed virus 1 TaxID=1273750 RepID=R4T6H2_9CAUD|nr:hypothetical protein M198_gp45 [Haloarcula hispanica tailed virus 1]AGM11299.1 hypothetical protein HHTV1_45 [Haloarcula hispanica tailed virus 1]
MEPNSETRGIYLARTVNGELNTGFDAKRVLKGQQGGA